MIVDIGFSIDIDDREIQFDFIRSPGPGGQNVNKVATSVRLRFDVLNSPSLPDGIKARLVRLAGSRMTDEGVLVIEARRFRAQEQNRTDALERLAGLIRKAARPPVPRRATRPTRASQVKRVDTKKKHAEIKRTRGRVHGMDE